MGSPRILVLTSTFPSSDQDGTPAFVADLSRELAKDFEVRILAPAVPGGAARETLGPGLTVERYRYFPRRWEDLADGAILENVRSRRSRLLQVPFLLLGMALAVTRARRSFRPDALHVHWIIPQGIVARRVAGRTPAVVTTLGGDLYALNSRVARALKTDVLRHASAVTVMNDDMRDRAVDLGADPRTTSVMPMGARFEHPGADATSSRTTDGVVRLLAVGRLVPKKGFDVLLRALAHVDADIELDIVGDGPQRPELEALASGIGRVTFSGQLGRRELSERYARADIAVFPSRRAESGDQDGLPVALLEAMGAGCAVIASDLPGLSTAVEDGVSGIIVPENDEGALREAVQSLAHDAARRTSLGSAARSRSSRYSVEAVGEGYRRLFHDVLRS